MYGKVPETFFLLLLFFFFPLGPHPQHRQVPRLGDQYELQLLAYTIAKAMENPSGVCNLYHSSQQHQILNPLSEARDRTRILMYTSQVHYHSAPTGTPR